MSRLTGVVVGCGAIAREHLAAISSLKNVEVIAVCDLSAARAEAAADRFGIGRWYTDHQKLLDEISPDLVHITTPPLSHFPIAKDCLSLGRNVLCEKPICESHQKFLILKELAVQNQCLLLENQNFRFHSSIKKIIELVESGAIGTILDVNISLSLNLFQDKSPYTDLNAPASFTNLPGGVIGDFLPHIAYLSYLFTGPVQDLCTIWKKSNGRSPLAFDEFRGLINGQKATATVSFSGNAQPDGFWVRVVGTKANVEANLYEPPRLVARRLRSGEPALAKLADGIAEAFKVFSGSAAALGRKLAGRSSYDGLAEFVERTYLAIGERRAPPVELSEIDATSLLVDNFSAVEFRL